MKSYIILYRRQVQLLVVLTLFFACFTACKKEETNTSSAAPVIRNLRAIAPAPNDSTLTKVSPGQLVVLQGDNFLGVKAVYFNGVLASFNAALVGKQNLVVTVPEPDFVYLPVRH